nr:efflux RND transporter permease subunit [Coxiella endosymbiont of Ornithodoros amblus]
MTLLFFVENVDRHIEEGVDGFHEAIRKALEIVFPIISDLTLAALYAPIGFMTGLTGALFTEFAFTLAGAVIVSGIISLTLITDDVIKIFKPKH